MMPGQLTLAAIHAESLLAAGSRARVTPKPSPAVEGPGVGATLPFGTVGTLAVLALLLVVMAWALLSTGRTRSGMAPKSLVRRELGRPALNRAAPVLRPALIAARKEKAS